MADEIDATVWVQAISPRPIFIMHGGRDPQISPDSGQQLYEAAGEPKELWFEPDLGHIEFDTHRSEEFEERIVAFFDRHVLGSGPNSAQLVDSWPVPTTEHITIGD